MGQVLFQDREITCFSRISLHVTKNELLMTMFNEKGSGLTRMNLCSVLHGGASRKKGYAVCMAGSPQYFLFSVFKRQLDTQCSQHLQRLFKNLLRKRPELVSWRNIVLLHDNTRPHSAMNHAGKDIGSTIYTRPCNKWFPSFIFSTKSSQEDEVKTFLLGLKTSWFFIRRIHKLLDKLQEVIQNYDECTIEWN